VSGPAAREACRLELRRMAGEDPRVLCVDGDTGGLDEVFADLPAQYVNAGIAEANMIGMAAGLAAGGFVPYVHTISTFVAARACEQVKVDVAGNGLPVRLVVSHGGLSAGHYGPSHHAVEDIALMRVMPNMTVVVPADADAAVAALRAVAGLPGPVFLRLGRSATPPVPGAAEGFRLGRATELAGGDDVAILATGPHPVRMALEAAARLAGSGVAARVLDMHTVKPLDEEAVVAAARATAGIVTVEDHLVLGGLGGAVSEVVATEHPCRVLRIGVPDGYRDEVGDERHLLRRAGVDPDRIVAAALRIRHDRD
jgi:transketolase